MTDHMSLNKQLGIACGVPVALLLGGIGVSGLPSASSTPPAKSVAAANEEFKAQVTPVGLESETSPEAPAEPETGVSTGDVKSELAGLYTFGSDAAEETTTLKPAIDTEATTTADVPPAITVDETPIENVLDTGDSIDPGILADLTSSDPVPDAPEEEKADLVWSDPAPASPPKTQVVEADPPQESLALVDPASSSDEPAPAEPPASTLSEVVADPEPAEAPAPEITEVVTADPAPAEPPAPEVVEVAADPAPAEPPVVREVAAVEAVEPVALDEVATTASVTTESDVVPEVSSPAPPSPPVVSASEPVPVSTVATIPTAKPFLGVGIRDASNSKITTLHKSTTAEQLGILVGDELIGVNGYPVRNIATLRAVLKDISVGDAISVSIRRNGAIYKMGPLSLGARPSE